jgi:type IV pilus assembly protein PilB
MRISTLPTQFGEKVVIRLLDRSRGPRRLEDADLSPQNQDTFKSLLSRTQGMMLVTGPTGSGKTSTLYSAINSIKTPTTNIITVEDPIEIQMPGINQVQINPRAGVTFAVGLRSILRQDPNVILVGEIRDAETAGIACEAAQTGHLLLSTLHTNDATATITRLLDLNIEPFLVASSLIGVLGQRLLRKLCPACRVQSQPSPEVLHKSGASTLTPPDQVWWAGQGCEQCGHTGFRGRFGIHELLVVNDEIKDLISSRAPEHAIRAAARRHGMVTLMEDGVAKATMGLTTLDELVRVVNIREIAAVTPAPQAPAAGAPSASSEEMINLRDGRKRRVLVVEDSQTVSTVVKYFLELEGFDVTIAEDGAQGLQMAVAETPDLIISDVHMPGMDGITMLRSLRAEPLTRDIPVLVLSAESSVEAETAGLESGADDYLAKPVEPRRLAARAKTLLTRSSRLRKIS